MERGEGKIVVEVKLGLSARVRPFFPGVTHEEWLKADYIRIANCEAIAFLGAAYVSVITGRRYSLLSLLYFCSPAG